MYPCRSAPGANIMVKLSGLNEENELVDSSNWDKPNQL